MVVKNVVEGDDDDEGVSVEDIMEVKNDIKPLIVVSGGPLKQPSND